MVRRHSLNGVTLIELLLSIALTVVIGLALTYAFSAVALEGPRLAAHEATFDSQITLDDKLSSYISHAWISGTANDNKSYLTTSPVDLTSGTPSQSSPTSSSATSISSTGGQSQTLVFTAIGLKVPTYVVASKDDFETANTDFGPQGGVAEVSFSLTPVGDAGDKKGLFMRLQRPADTDPTQGGNEQLLLDNVTSLQFEFFDGTQWQQSWDTPTMTPPRLPAAIRISYTIGDAQTPHTFVVRLPLSNVTTANPVTQTGGTQ